MDGYIVYEALHQKWLVCRGFRPQGGANMDTQLKCFKSPSAHLQQGEIDRMPGYDIHETLHLNCDHSIRGSETLKRVNVNGKIILNFI